MRNDNIRISNEVFAIIAATAVLEVPGVHSLYGNNADIKEILGMKNMTKGVVVEVHDDEVEISLNIISNYGFNVHEVAKEAQENIKKAINVMTGLNANNITINVIDIKQKSESIYA